MACDALRVAGGDQRPDVLRQPGAAIGRRVSTLCKGEDGLGQQLGLYHVYDNFVLPHASVRQPVPQPVLTHGTGAATQCGRRRQRWRRGSPIMSGRCVRCCCIGCPRGPSQRGCEQATGVGSNKEGWLAQAPCVHTTGVEDVTRGERATGRLGALSFLGLFALVTADG